ncbi:MAG: CDP-alcohol phosphatidyltransferase family protein [Propionibacteriaceae bacterium]|jgi:phosphatidylglycerophosphate synthase|nr:CDP-alcohol phosphatidyltransferase family protein [Propionibacteriaceae bacterium]
MDDVATLVNTPLHKPRRIVRQLPNAMSVLRIAGALVLPLLMWRSWEQTIHVPLLGTFTGVPVVWLIAFLILALTDKADGTVARKFKVESELGATLDAVGDAVLLVVGATCVFVVFARGLTPFRFWFYVGIMVMIVAYKFLVYAVTKHRFGVGNMLHSLPHKAFAVGAVVAIALWAFTRTMDAWSILALWAIITYAVVDEIVYIQRAATYNVDFKGHGFEKYEVRSRPLS